MQTFAFKYQWFLLTVILMFYKLDQNWKYNLFMKYNKIGNTGMSVSNLSFGASSLGGVFRKISEAEAIKSVFTAVDNGINFIDVSPYYGHLKAEIVLGKALKEIPRNKYYLSTKVGRYGKDGVNFWDYSAKRATESVFESMKRLNVEYIDLISVHDIEFSDLNQVVEETIPALVELRNKGVVGHVGITDLQIENLQWVIDHSDSGMIETVLNFCHHCLNDDKLVDYLDYFKAKDIGVINASPLAMGLLSKRGVPDWHPAPPALVNACKEASKLCMERGVSIEKLAIQFAVSNPEISTTLFSSANPENVLRNIKYLEEPLDIDLIKDVQRVIGDQKRVSWKNS